MDQPIFTLKAQDVTAPMVVKLWADLQRFLDLNRKRGFSTLESLTVLEQRCSAVCEDTEWIRPIPDKIQSAYRIAEEMEDWPHSKKIAD